MEALQKQFPDVDPFLLHKWKRLYELFFDANSSSSLEHKDFYIVLKKVKDLYGAESQEFALAKNTMNSLWEGLLKTADVNNDQIVSLDEWVGALSKCLADKESPWFNDYMTYMFKLFDVSKDNNIDSEEYADGMKTYGYGHADAVEAYKKFSVDDAGKPVDVDFKRFTLYWHDYFYSTDKNAKGNYLFGVREM